MLGDGRAATKKLGANTKCGLRELGVVLAVNGNLNGRRGDVT